jgi:S-adenosylmethionine synthetase
MIESIIKKEVVDAVLNIYSEFNKGDIKFLINPSGRFTIWGSFGDSGCVGRKIVVDTYGGVGRVGGGCFSSKNATKVDRSGAYYARYVAKNIVARGYADKCEIQVSYFIGRKEPVSLCIETFGTNTIAESEIEKRILDKFDMRPASIIKYLNLRTPLYAKTTNYGHFGKENMGLKWEEVVDLR